MKIRQLKLRYFRNYGNCTLQFSDGIHIFHGKNAQGKTNLLEALLYLSTTRSHRTNRDIHLIQNEQSSFYIQGDIEKQHKREILRVSVSSEGKNIFLFDKSIPNVSSFIGLFNAILFAPDDMHLFQASPKARRKFIDMEMSKLSKTYMNTLNQSLKLLKDRNVLLKRSKPDMHYLGVLNEQLCKLQAILIRQRYFFIRKLAEKANVYYQRISNDQTSFDITYLSCTSYDDVNEVMVQSLKERYEKSLDKDLNLKMTTIGIHKDDYRFMIDGKAVELHASQGQKRSILLALKLAMIDLIHEISHEYPVLLLDDVFSELDYERRNRLFEILPMEVQVFIASAELDKDYLKTLHRPITLWEIENGSVKGKEIVYG
jgi:DNA replication and repair protein RecF